MLSPFGEVPLNFLFYFVEFIASPTISIVHVKFIVSEKMVPAEGMIVIKRTARKFALMDGQDRIVALVRSLTD